MQRPLGPLSLLNSQLARLAFQARLGRNTARTHKDVIDAGHGQHDAVEALRSPGDWKHDALSYRTASTDTALLAEPVFEVGATPAAHAA